MKRDSSTNTPLVRCFRLEAGAPSLEDNLADIDRLKQALGTAFREEGASDIHIHVPLGLLKGLAFRFRTAGFCGYAVVAMLTDRAEVIDFKAHLPEVLPAMALDLGTTHLEASLLDLLTGREIAAGHAENQQIRYGDDILSRIHKTTPGKKSKPGDIHSGLLKLQQSVIGSINELAGELAGKADIDSEEICALSVSGNTTMVHLFLGVSPYHICREPYTPLVNDPDPCHAGDLGLDLAPMAPVWVLPSIGSYFGGDLVSGIVACGLDNAEQTRMLIDVGTNAEVVLGNRDWLIACAGAAGPALEGGVARMGMRAGPGAIEHVSIDPDTWSLEFAAIENAPARGICGSGLIDLVAALYLARIIDFRGKLRRDIVPESRKHAAFLEERLIIDESEPSFIVARKEEAEQGRPVALSQLDLDAIMRSKAAMYAILTTLVSQVGIDFGDIEKIYVAGAFGKHIDPHRAITLGMLPDLALTTYEPVGNSSLQGAVMILLSDDCRERSKQIRQKITYVELNVNQEFMIRFSGSRLIPHTDPSLFPSVPLYQGGSS